MFCGNSKVFDGMIISLLSIAKHTKEALNVFILTMDLRSLDENYKPVSENQVKILEEIIKKKIMKVKLL